MLLILFNRGGGVAPPPAVTVPRLIALKGYDSTRDSLVGDAAWPSLKGYDGHAVHVVGDGTQTALKGWDSTRKALTGDNG